MAISLLSQRLMQKFSEMRDPTLFLASFFSPKDGSTGVNGLKVSIDVERDSESIAPVITRGSGANMSDSGQFVTHEYEPPVMKEGVPFHIEDFMNRMAGEDPFSAGNRPYASKIAAKMVTEMVRLDKRLQRTRELMAAQILQTGILTLPAPDGTTGYTLDFNMKGTHQVTVATPWSTAASAKPLTDLENLAEVIRDDSGIDSDVVIFGRTAWDEFRNTDQFKNQADNRGFQQLQAIDPRFAGRGATFQGTLWLGNYRVECFTYNKAYDAIGGGKTKYVEDAKVIMTSKDTRFDMLGTRVPRVVQPDPRVRGLMPGRMLSREGGFDVTPNIWTDAEGTQINLSLETRSMLVPTQIDGYGFLNT